jgi:hypothetical protein
VAFLLFFLMNLWFRKKKATADGTIRVSFDNNNHYNSVVVMINNNHYHDEGVMIIVVKRNSYRSINSRTDNLDITDNTNIDQMKRIYKMQDRAGSNL